MTIQKPEEIVAGEVYTSSHAADGVPLYLLVICPSGATAYAPAKAALRSASVE